MHSLKGVGALVFGSEVESKIKPVFLGGHQEYGLRPGTPSVEAIYSMGMAADIAKQLDYVEMRKKKQYMLDNLTDIGIVNGAGATQLENTVNISFPSVKDNFLLIDELSSKGVMVSGTSACNSGLNITSRVLRAMYGQESSRPASSLRISFSTTTSWDDIIRGTKIIRDTVTST
jgi:cysteine desulfurase